MNIAPFFDEFYLNFDKLFTDLSKTDSFPKYNIIKLSDSEIELQIACAGYSKDELELSLQNNILSVVGTKKQDDKYEYLHKGITTREFYKQWSLPKNMEIIDAKYEDGILKINCKIIIPENEKVKKIAIN